MLSARLQGSCKAPLETPETHNIDAINQREHGPRVAIHDEGAVELVRAPGRLLDGHRCVGHAELGRRVEVTQILALVEGDARLWRHGHGLCDDGGSDDGKEAHAGLLEDDVGGCWGFRRGRDRGSECEVDRYIEMKYIPHEGE
jgi:hypothetical protein